MAGSDEASLGFGRARCARKGADRGGQPHKIESLALECVRCPFEPFVNRALRAPLKSKLDQSRITAVKAAEQMHRVSHVATRVASAGVKQGRKM